MDTCPRCAPHVLPTPQGIFSPELVGESQVQAGLKSLLRAKLLLRSLEHRALQGETNTEP